MCVACQAYDISIECCRRREQQTAKLRKTAEKLLMAQLKKHALQADTSLKVRVLLMQREWHCRWCLQTQDIKHSEKSLVLDHQLKLSPCDCLI